MSSVPPETAQLSGAVVFRLTARVRFSAGSHPREIEELVACYLAGATALALAGKHSIHRTTVLALLERHRVSRRGRVLTPDHIEQVVSLYASGLSCVSIGRELQVNPETVRQALLKGRRANAQARANTSHGVLNDLDWRYRVVVRSWKHSRARTPPGSLRAVALSSPLAWQLGEMRSVCRQCAG
jgi:hypothetical protein